MREIINVECKNLDLFYCGGTKVSGDFICFDADQQPLNISVPIYEQLHHIYRNVSFTEKFVKRLEYKLKLTLRMKSANLTFVREDEEWRLQTSLCEIYDPVTLTHDCIKIGDNPLTIEGKILNIFSSNGKCFLVCLVGKINLESNELLQRLEIITITEEVNSIYYDRGAKKRCRDMLKIKFKNKKDFSNALDKYLEGKTLRLEYDEHYGYSLWTPLYDFIVGDE